MGKLLVGDGVPDATSDGVLYSGRQMFRVPVIDLTNTEWNDFPSGTTLVDANHKHAVLDTGFVKLPDTNNEPFVLHLYTKHDTNVILDLSNIAIHRISSSVTNQYLNAGAPYDLTKQITQALIQGQTSIDLQICYHNVSGYGFLNITSSITNLIVTGTTTV